MWDLRLAELPRRDAGHRALFVSGDAAGLHDPAGVPASDAVAWLLDRLVPATVAVAVEPARDRCDALMIGEHAAIARASAPRRAEFSTGRACARRVLAAIGRPRAAIPAGPDGLPVWPDGVAGSLSHAHGLCAAAATLTRHAPALGLDLEWIAGVEASLLPVIAGPDEVARNWSQVPPSDLPACLFSVREAAFKAYYPAVGVFLDFSDLDVDLDAGAGRFAVRLLNPDHPPLFGARTIGGRFGTAAGFVAALALCGGTAA